MDLFDLSAKITLDSSEYERGLDKAGGKLSWFGSKLKSGFATAAKVSAAAMGAAAVAAGALAKQAVNAYADYQQLVGGVETLFSNLDGTVSAAPAVLEAAANAYKTAGLSANQYMEAVTSFSAALVSSLENDYDKAAQISDMAITDMADNANKMGTSMESIQAAYAGFAKGNYTMLDNLKLGYGGTQAEMQRLLSDAEALTGVHYDISNLSDVYEAIHVIQTEMGITGTTAKEAASTISGSFGMLQGAWANFIAGLGNSDADISALIGNVVDAGKTFLSNLMPVVQQVLQSLAKAVEEIGPVLMEAIPPIVESLLPALLSAAIGLVQSIANALPGLLQVLVDQLPTIIPALVQATVSIVSTLVTQLPAILAALWEGIKVAAQELWPVLEQAFAGLGAWFRGKFSEAWAAVQSVFSNIGEFFRGIWDKISNTFSELGTKIGDAISGAVTAGINGIIGFAESIVNQAIDIINGAIRLINKLPGVEVGFIDPVEFPRLAIGKDYVPYDNYPAYLHKGEAVLTAREAEEWRRGGNGNEKVVNLNIYAQQLSKSDMDYIVATVNRELA